MAFGPVPYVMTRPLQRLAIPIRTDHPHSARPFRRRAVRSWPRRCFPRPEHAKVIGADIGDHPDVPPQDVERTFQRRPAVGLADAHFLDPVDVGNPNPQQGPDHFEARIPVLWTLFLLESRRERQRDELLGRCLPAATRDFDEDRALQDRSPVDGESLDEETATRTAQESMDARPERMDHPFDDTLAAS
jgi:hypothetical protein